MREIVKTELTVYEVIDDKTVRFGIAFHYADGGETRVGGHATIGETDSFDHEEKRLNIRRIECDPMEDRVAHFDKEYARPISRISERF